VEGGNAEVAVLADSDMSDDNVGGHTKLQVRPRKVL
jgi:hypothetical protein